MFSMFKCQLNFNKIRGIYKGSKYGMYKSLEITRIYLEYQTKEALKSVYCNFPNNSRYFTVSVQYFKHKIQNRALKSLLLTIQYCPFGLPTSSESNTYFSCSYNREMTIIFYVILLFVFNFLSLKNNVLSVQTPGGFFLAILPHSPLYLLLQCILIFVLYV